MVFSLPRYIVFIVTVLILTAVQVRGQIYTESVTTGISAVKQRTRSYYMPGMFRVVQDNGDIMIMRFDRDLWISVDSRRKEYWQMTFSELESKMKGMESQMDAAMQQMQNQLASMPPEQRKMMEQMMGRQLGSTGGGGRLEVKQGGKSRTISGFRCTQYSVTEDGKEVLVLWTTKGVKEFGRMRKDYKRFSRSMAGMTGSKKGGGADSLSRAWVEVMKAVDGFPMEHESAGSKTTVTKLERRSTPAAAFEPPSGHKEVPPPF
jgi:hypothetical protein